MGLPLWNCRCGVIHTDTDACSIVELGSVLFGCCTQVRHRPDQFRQVAGAPPTLRLSIAHPGRLGFKHSSFPVGLDSLSPRHHSAAAFGTPRTSIDYGFCRWTSATANSRQPPTDRCPPTLRPRPLLRRPGAIGRSAAQASPLPVITVSTPSPVILLSLQLTTPRLTQALPGPRRNPRLTKPPPGRPHHTRARILLHQAPALYRHSRYLSTARTPRGRSDPQDINSFGARGAFYRHVRNTRGRTPQPYLGTRSELPPGSNPPPLVGPPS